MHSGHRALQDPERDPLRPRDEEDTKGLRRAGATADMDRRAHGPERGRPALPDLAPAEAGAVRDGDRGLPPTDALAFRGPQEHERPDIGHHTATKADRQGERHPRRAAEPAEPELRGETHAEEHAVRPA